MMSPYQVDVATATNLVAAHLQERLYRCYALDVSVVGSVAIAGRDEDAGDYLAIGKLTVSAAVNGKPWSWVYRLNGQFFSRMMVAERRDLAFASTTVDSAMILAGAFAQVCELAGVKNITTKRKKAA